MRGAKRGRKLLVVDDDKETLEGYRNFLGKEFQLFFCESGEAAIALAYIEELPVAILDLQLKGISGIETLKQLREINPFIEAIILTGKVTAESAVSAVNLGAFRYFCKPFNISNLRNVLSKAHRRYDARSDRKPLVFTAGQLMVLGLSEREASVAREVLRCRTNAEIGEKLGISRRTVEKHVEAIFEVFGIVSRSMLLEKLQKRWRDIPWNHRLKLTRRGSREIVSL